jgi:hypothetical protein
MFWCTRHAPYLVHKGIQMTHRLVLAILLLLVLVGCTEPPAPPVSQTAQTPIAVASPNEAAQSPTLNVTVLPAPDQTAVLATSETSSAVAGTAAISGQVVSNTDREPIRDTVIFLAQVYADANTGQEAFALDLANSPASFTDEEGNFIFTGIAPGRYVISVGDFYGVKDVVREPNGDAQIFTLEAEREVEAGTLQVRPDVTSGR